MTAHSSQAFIDQRKVWWARSYGKQWQRRYFYRKNKKWWRISLGTESGGARGDYGYSAAPLGDGSALVTGFFYNNAQFGDISVSATNKTNINDRDAFVAKLNQQGEYEWVLLGRRSRYRKSIISLNDGSSIVTGYLQGTNLGNTQLVSEEWWCIYRKIESKWVFAWAKQFGGTGGDAGVSIANLDDKNLITDILAELLIFLDIADIHRWQWYLPCSIWSKWELAFRTWY